jgi:hypothetical protein
VHGSFRRRSFEERRAEAFERSFNRLFGVTRPNDFEKVETGKMMAAGGWEGDVEAFIRMGHDAAKRMKRRRHAAWRRLHARTRRGRPVRRRRRRRTRTRTRARSTGDPEGSSRRAFVARNAPRRAP